jgi:hypothetical protein
MTRVHISLLFLLILGSRHGLGLEIRGKVTIASSGCPVSGLTIEIDPEKTSKQAKIVTTTNVEGGFTANVVDGRYLLQIFQNGIKVYQDPLAGSGVTSVNVSLNPVKEDLGKTCESAAPSSSPQTKSINDWRPVDLSFSSAFGLLVLDEFGRVTHITFDKRGIASETLFTLPRGASLESITSGGDKVFATRHTPDGCIVYEFDRTSSSREAVPRLLLATDPCSGIATDGHSVEVTFARSDDRYFPDWDINKWHSTGLSGLLGPSTIALDPASRLMFIGDSDGKVYQMTFGGNGRRQVINGGDRVNSLALSTKYLIIAPGTHLIYYKRENFKRQPPSSCWSDVSLSGDLVGVRVDLEDRAWVLSARNTITGPIALK